MGEIDKGVSMPTLDSNRWVEDIQIDEGVPLPSKKARYNFEKMNIGDSMYFDDLRAMESAFSAARAYAKRNKNGFKMTSRKLGEDSYRLWRIK